MYSFQKLKSLKMYESINTKVFLFVRLFVLIMLDFQCGHYNLKHPQNGHGTNSWRIHFNFCTFIYLFINIESGISSSFTGESGGGGGGKKVSCFG